MAPVTAPEVAASAVCSVLSVPVSEACRMCSALEPAPSAPSPIGPARKRAHPGWQCPRNGRAPAQERRRLDELMGNDGGILDQRRERAAHPLGLGYRAVGGLLFGGVETFEKFLGALRGS